MRNVAQLNWAEGLDAAISVQSCENITFLIRMAAFNGAVKSVLSLMAILMRLLQKSIIVNIPSPSNLLNCGAMGGSFPIMKLAMQLGARNFTEAMLYASGSGQVRMMIYLRKKAKDQIDQKSARDMLIDHDDVPDTGEFTETLSGTIKHTRCLRILIKEYNSIGDMKKYLIEASETDNVRALKFLRRCYLFDRDEIEEAEARARWYEARKAGKFLTEWLRPGRG